ncbi:hypothetical protein P3T76_011377 [Phytophthora citrophthora]|uniref:Uncharacterized protein n=1 Tax=Phytophthora citrophthora TaxID=4793 RepID=A0AAD9G955_9STRA|nr:hypothetical protein P3T76_011377 [Phytophthora citrophthora]
MRMRDKALRDAREEQQELEALHRLDEECVHQQRAGNYLKAFDCMERALVLRRHFFGIESQEVIQACRALAEMCNLLAMSFLQQDNYPVTIDLLKKAEVLTQRHHPVERATTLNNFACYYRRLGKLHSAMTSLKRALELEKRLENVRNTADTQLNMCAVLSQLGKHQEALEHAQEALISLQEGFIHGKDTTDTDNSAMSSSRLDRISVMCIAYHNIGVEQEFLKDCAESVISYKKGVGLAEQYLGADHSITTTIRNSYLGAKRTLASKTRVQPRSATRDSKSPTKAGVRLLTSPRSGSIRMPSPLTKEKDNGLHIATPRSIIADALSRAPLSALPPLELQSPPSASKKKKNKLSSDANSGLSPTDPFFSPRFRFDSDTTGSKVKKLTSISPRTTSAQAPPSSKAKRERRKSSVKKPPTAVETSRKVAKTSVEEVPKATATGKTSGGVQMEAPDINEPRQDPIETASENLEPSEHPNAALGDADRSVSMVLTNVIDKVAEQEEVLNPVSDEDAYLEEQHNDKIESSVKDDAFEEEPVAEAHNNEIYVESLDKLTTNCLEDNADVGLTSCGILEPMADGADGAGGEQHQDSTMEVEADLTDVNSAPEANLNEANTKEPFENAGTSLDDTQNDSIAYASDAVAHDIHEEWNPEVAIDDIAEAQHSEDLTIPEESYSSSAVAVDESVRDILSTPCNEGEEAPVEPKFEEQPDAQDQMSAEQDLEQGFDQDWEEKQILSDDTGELPANGQEAQDEQYVHAATEENLPLAEESPLATENYDAGDYPYDNYPSVVSEEWDAIDQQPTEQDFVGQSEYVASSYEQQGYEVAADGQADWNQVEQTEPFATENAAEYNNFYPAPPEEQPPDDAVTVDADQIQEG